LSTAAKAMSAVTKRVAGTSKVEITAVVIIELLKRHFPSLLNSRMMAPKK